MKRVAVFCGSRLKGGLQYRPVAKEVGRLIAEAGMEVVYGGSSIGMMGDVANAALEAGGKVIGVIPDFLMDKELGHKGITELHVVTSMHERKALMTELSDGFVTLPGGIGTMEEFFEVLSWAQLGIHRLPCGLLNVNGFFDGVINFLDHAVGDDLIRPEHRALVLEETDPAHLLASMTQHGANSAA